MVNVHVCNKVFIGKNYLNNCHSIANTKDLTLKQMFDISTRWVSEQDEISGMVTIGWEIHSWKYMSLIGDERIINLQRMNVYVFSDSVLCLGRIRQNPESNKAWEQRIGWITSSQSYRDFDGIDGEPTKFEWNIFPGFDTLQLCDKVKDLLSRLEETPQISQEEFYLCRCSTIFLVEQETMSKNVWQTLDPKEIAHVMSGIICCACSILAISVLQCALTQWRNDLNKIQDKNESQQNRDR